MYYVVYLVEFDVQIAIPYTWIQDDMLMLQKFVRGGMNCSQTHWCFSSNKVEAKVIQNGKSIPNIDFAADFDSAPSDFFPCDAGIFKCRVMDFFGNNNLQ